MTTIEDQTQEASGGTATLPAEPTTSTAAEPAETPSQARAASVDPTPAAEPGLLGGFFQDEEDLRSTKLGIALGFGMIGLFIALMWAMGARLMPMTPF